MQTYSMQWPVFIFNICSTDYLYTPLHGDKLLPTSAGGRSPSVLSREGIQGRTVSAILYVSQKRAKVWCLVSSPLPSDEIAGLFCPIIRPKFGYEYLVTVSIILYGVLYYRDRYTGNLAY